jgi:hypothetical protein
MVGRAVVVKLHDLRAVGRGHAVHAEHLKQCDAEAVAGTTQSTASGPSLTRGNAVIRIRWAPIGSRLTVSVGSVERAGLCCNVRTTPSASACQFGIFRTLTRSSTGAPSLVKGFAASGPDVQRQATAPLYAGRRSTYPA